MEILIQWLDELEDLVVALVSVWHGLCRLCLGLGLTASLLVLAPAVASLPLLLVLTAIAGASVLAWSTAVCVTLARSERPNGAAA